VPASVWEDIPLTLTGKLEAQPDEIEFAFTASARALAWRARTRRLSTRRMAAQRRYRARQFRLQTPNCRSSAASGARNSSFTDDFYRDVSGANAGVQLNWSLWDGSQNPRPGDRSQGPSTSAPKSIARTRAGALNSRFAPRYSSFLEAKQVLASQLKVLEQAEEALRLARSRYEAGTGTQLDVLDAQTALTDARTTHVRALREYSVALARLQRAVGWDVAHPQQVGMPNDSPAPGTPHASPAQQPDAPDNPMRLGPAPFTALQLPIPQTCWKVPIPSRASERESQNWRVLGP